MTEHVLPPELIDNAAEDFRARADLLEQKLADFQRQSDSRLIRAEMKAEAIRAGIVDLDGLNLLDLSAVTLNEKGEVDNATGLIASFKKSKPWLFGMASSSSLTATPLAQPVRQKHATEMTNTEYAAARAALLKKHY